MASVLQGEQPGNKVRRWPPSRCTASGWVQVPANTMGPVPIDVPGEEDRPCDADQVVAAAVVGGLQSPPAPASRPRPAQRTTSSRSPARALTRASAGEVVDQPESVDLKLVDVVAVHQLDRHQQDRERCDQSATSPECLGIRFDLGLPFPLFCHHRAFPPGATRDAKGQQTACMRGPPSRSSLVRAGCVRIPAVRFVAGTPG
jgi:hypothetical protein